MWGTALKETVSGFIPLTVGTIISMLQLLQRNNVRRESSPKLGRLLQGTHGSDAGDVIKPGVTSNRIPPGIICLQSFRSMITSAVPACLCTVPPTMNASGLKPLAVQCILLAPAGRNIGCTCPYPVLQSTTNPRDLLAFTPRRASASTRTPRSTVVVWATRLLCKYS